MTDILSSASKRIFSTGTEEVETKFSNAKHDTFSLFVKSGSNPEFIMRGYMTSDITVSIQPRWGEPFIARTLQQLNNTLSGLAIIGDVAGVKETQNYAEITASSTARFQGINKMSISIPYMLITIDENDDIISKLREFHALAVPSTAYETSKLQETAFGPVIDTVTDLYGRIAKKKVTRKKTNPIVKIYDAPLGYTPNDTDKGKIGLSVGHWFSTNKLFICKGLDYTISKETTTTKQPLYITGTLSFESYKVLDLKDMIDMFNMSRFAVTVKDVEKAVS